MSNFSNDNDLIHRHAQESAVEYVADALQTLKENIPGAQPHDFQQLLAAQVLAAAITEASAYVSRAIENLASALREQE